MDKCKAEYRCHKYMEQYGKGVGAKYREHNRVGMLQCNDQRYARNLSKEEAACQDACSTLGLNKERRYGKD